MYIIWNTGGRFGKEEERVQTQTDTHRHLSLCYDGVLGIVGAAIAYTIAITILRDSAHRSKYTAQIHRSNLAIDFVIKFGHSDSASDPLYYQTHLAVRSTSLCACICAGGL